MKTQQDKINEHFLKDLNFKKICSGVNGLLIVSFDDERWGRISIGISEHGYWVFIKNDQYCVEIKYEDILVMPLLPLFYLSFEEFNKAVLRGIRMANLQDDIMATFPYDNLLNSVFVIESEGWLYDSFNWMENLILKNIFLMKLEKIAFSNKFSQKLRHKAKKLWARKVKEIPPVGGSI